MEYHIYNKARKRVKQKRRFYSHLMSWMVMSVFFILINLFTSSGVFWAIFPILGWGVGVAFHGIQVYSISYSDEWEEKEIRKEMDKIMRKENLVHYLEESDKLRLKELDNLRNDWEDSEFV